MKTQHDWRVNGMDGDELSAFRESWKHELEKKTTTKEKEGYFGQPSNDKSSSNQNANFWEKQSNATQQTKPRPKEQPQYLSIAEGLLEGRTSPLLDRIEEERTRRKRAPESEALNKSAPPRKVSSCNKLLDQFLQDLVSG